MTGRSGKPNTPYAGAKEREQLRSAAQDALTKAAAATVEAWEPGHIEHAIIEAGIGLYRLIELDVRSGELAKPRVLAFLDRLSSSDTER